MNYAIIDFLFRKQACWPQWSHDTAVPWTKVCKTRTMKNGRGSYYINIPKEIMKELHWKERQKLTVQKYKNKLIIKDWKEE